MVLALLFLCLSVLPAIYGQLSTAEKQTLLDLHNKLRGSAGGANIVQSVSTLLYAWCSLTLCKAFYPRHVDLRIYSMVWLIHYVDMGCRASRNSTEIC